MRHQIISALFSVLLMLLLVPGAFGAQFHVGAGQTYATIQAGVDAAGADDIVIVHDGLYVENILITTPITLHSLDFINNGENDDVQIDAGDGYGIEVQCSGVTIEGFSIYGNPGTSEGIHLFESDNCTIAHNRCGWEEDVYENCVGIVLEWSDGNLIQHNTTSYCQVRGISIMESRDNTIRHNTASFIAGSTWACGIHLYGPESRGNLIQDNYLGVNSMGILVVNLATHNTSSRNTITDCSWGIYNDGFYNVHESNIVQDCGKGIHVRNSQYWAITGNLIDSCQYGITLGFGYNPGGSLGEISFNTIINNTIAGLTLNYNSNMNTVFLNNFSGNATDIIDDSGFKGDADKSRSVGWQTQTPCSYFFEGNSSNYLGNYYDSYMGSDDDGDGIGDTDLPFDGGNPTQGPSEMYPLISSPPAYALQAWFLGGEASMAMVCGDPSQVVEQIHFADSQSLIWLSDQPASENIDFANGSWSGRMSFVGAPAPDAAYVEIGSSTDGTDFSPSGAEVTVGGATDVAFITSSVPVNIGQGQYLALRITSQSTWGFDLMTGGARTYLTSPGLDDPQWPGGIVGVDPDAGLDSRLWQNCPNPFNPQTRISYNLPEQTTATLRIFDLAGRLVDVLVESETLPAGSHNVTWAGLDSKGQAVPSGVYFYRLEAVGYSETKRMTLIR